MAQLYRSQTWESTVRQWCVARLEAWDAPHSTDVVETSLGRTHLTIAGNGSDTCLYLPGTNFNAATSLGLLERLAPRCRVVCVDLPGQPGLSSADRPGDETKGYARWVAEVLSAVGPGEPGSRTVLMGHSRGAAVALTAPPEEVAALVLLSPAGLAKVHLTPKLLARSVVWLARPTEARSRHMVELMSGAAPGPDLASVVEWMTLIARSTRTTGAPGPLPEGLVTRWRSHRPQVLVGANDVFFPASRVEGPVRRRLGGDLDVVAGAGHLLVDQRPDEVVRAVSAALARR